MLKYSMQKILITLLLSTLSLFSAEINWAKSYKEAISKAIAENKNVMVLMTTHTCRWCRKLESQTLTDAGIIERINRDYVPVHVTRDEDEYPASLDAPGVPATYFLNARGEPIIKRVMGYWNVEDYSSFLDDVDYKLGRKEY